MRPGAHLAAPSLLATEQNHPLRLERPLAALTGEPRHEPRELGDDVEPALVGGGVIRNEVSNQSPY